MDSAQLAFTYEIAKLLHRNYFYMKVFFLTLEFFPFQLFGKNNCNPLTNKHIVPTFADFQRFCIEYRKYCSDTIHSMYSFNVQGNPQPSATSSLMHIELGRL